MNELTIEEIRKFAESKDTLDKVKVKAYTLMDSIEEMKEVIISTSITHGIIQVVIQENDELRRYLQAKTDKVLELEIEIANLTGIDRTKEKLKEASDLSLLLDHWIIVRKDGTPVLNGTPEKFEKELREFLFVERS